LPSVEEDFVCGSLGRVVGSADKRKGITPKIPIENPNAKIRPTMNFS
jgi:hypothetical protein